VEADAISYAVAHGVVVVAAVGNGDQAPSTPWRFASYPAALPHVLGVSAIAKDGSSPLFSNRDAVYNDIAAPGEGILSTFPLRLTAQHPTCPDQGYSSCGPEDYSDGEGTSFAAPQVTAAAAMLLAVDPHLTPDQVTWVLERTADDATPSNGCAVCPAGRDAYTGWGRLDVAKAITYLSGELPPPDAYEPNDDAGPRAALLRGSSGSLNATIDFWDDQSDVYRVPLKKGQKLFAVLSGPNYTATAFSLWGPGTMHVDDLRTQYLRIRHARHRGSVQVISYRARRAGSFYLHVKIVAAGSGPYTLQFSKTPR